MDELCSLEYGSLKVPYEILNKRFRYLQKTLERDNCRVKECANDIQRRLQNRNSPIPVKMISTEVESLIEKVHLMRDHLTEGKQKEQEMASLLLARMDYLQSKHAVDGDHEKWKRERIDRLIVEYLLRAGLFDAAQKLADVAQVNMMCNRDVFVIAKQVEESLARHDVHACLEWIVENKSKLRRLRSELELLVRTQQCVEFIRQGDHLQAVLYARRHFAPLAAEQWTQPVQQVMGLLAFGASTSLEQYKDLVDENRWNKLIALFRHENARVFQLSEQSVFSVCLQTGISALKTPHCISDSESKCCVCQPAVFALAQGLPYAHTSQSRLICAYSGEPLNEHNQPMMLTNGMVYGEKSISALERDGNVHCPRTGLVCPLYQVVRVYVM